MDDLDLPLFQRHSRTSREAWEENLPRAGTLRAKVLGFIQDTAGATDEEISIMLRLNPSSARPRRVELVEAGLVKDSGLVKKTRSGRDAVIWAILYLTYPRGESL